MSHKKIELMVHLCRQIKELSKPKTLPTQLNAPS